MHSRVDLTAEQWRRVEELLPAALTVPAGSRRAFLDDACGGDAALRAELDALLAAHERTGPLDRPIAPPPPTSPWPPEAPGPGTVVSHYRIEERLGRGGMGVVLRARDLRLDRAVALKFLPSALSTDEYAKRRFLTEAAAAAALAHPNVCTVHDIGETEDGQLFIAMALVAGEPLRALIERGPLAIPQAVDIAGQITAGLGCAHRSGIVHRDVKPANVIVGDDGVVKLVDFGVAKLAGSTVTQVGATPGTAAYMSPEQARGEDVDARTDLWAVGVVLYEMLAGRRPFRGDTDAVVLRGITETTPPGLRTLRPDVPEALDGVVARALEKARERRFQSAGELQDALRRATGTGDDAVGVPLAIDGAPPAPAPAVPRPAALRFVERRAWPWIAAAAVAALATAGVAAYAVRGPAAPAGSATLRVSISAPGPLTPQLSAAISPDGRHVAFVAARGSGEAMLWVRALDRLEATPLAGTERAAHPFWSPDSRSIGFIADNRLKRVDLAGGPVRTLVDTVVRYGPAWAPDGTILFSRRVDELAAVSANGGLVTTVLTADPARQETAILWPRFLPDGRHFIFHRGSRQPERRGIYVGSLDSQETAFLLRSDFRAWYAPPGYLVYARGDTLFAQPFDPTRRMLVGEPAVIADGVWYARPAAQSSFSLSETGALAYVNATHFDGELVWFDRSGRSLGAAGPTARDEGYTPQVSPDGRRIAIARGEFGRENLWVLDAESGAANRLTFSPRGDGRVAVWASDGRRLMYTTGSRLLLKDVDTGAAEVLLDSIPGPLVDWSRDGRFAVFMRGGSWANLWVVALDGDRVPVPLVEGPYNATQAQISPDGKWIAYTSNESGRDEVYVQTFPTPGGKRQVSVAGGVMPRWRGDGGELFYLAANRFITAVPVLDPITLALGAPVPLFRTRLVVEGSESFTLPTRYDVAPDGQRFLLRYPPVDPGPPITVVISWLNALNR